MRPLLLSYTLIVLQGIALLVLALLGMPRFGGLLAVVLFLPAIVVNSWCVGAPAGYLMVLLGSFAVGSPAFLSLALTSPEHSAELFFAAIFAVEGGMLSFFLDTYCHDRQVEPHKKRAQFLQSEIRHLKQENEQAREEIRQRDEFLSIASHELKTPLTSMLLHIQTALHNIRTVSLTDFSIEKLMQMLERTQNQTKRLSKMINDLLNVSLITTGKLNLERESIDLARLVTEVAASFSERAQKDGYTIEVQTESVSGEWDRFRVEQALTNLISNALKYGNKKPITVQVRRRNGSDNRSRHWYSCGKTRTDFSLIRTRCLLTAL